MKVLKKYYKTSLVVADIILAIATLDSIVNDILPIVNFFFIGKMILSILAISVILTPIVGMIDFLLVHAIKSILVDYNKADRSGKLIIIIVVIVILLRKIIVMFN